MATQQKQALSVITPTQLGVDRVPVGNGPGLNPIAQSAWVNVNGWTYFSLSVNIENGVGPLFSGVQIRVAGRVNPAALHLGAGNAEVNAWLAKIGDLACWFEGPAYSQRLVVSATFRPLTIIWGRNAGDLSNVPVHGGDSELLKSCNFREALFQVWPVYTDLPAGPPVGTGGLITLQLVGG